MIRQSGIQFIAIGDRALRAKPNAAGRFWQASLACQNGNNRVRELLLLFSGPRLLRISPGQYADREPKKALKENGSGY
jgi:hypothetical protein